MLNGKATCVESRRKFLNLCLFEIRGVSRAFHKLVNPFNYTSRV